MAMRVWSISTVRQDHPSWEWTARMTVYGEVYYRGVKGNQLIDVICDKTGEFKEGILGGYTGEWVAIDEENHIVSYQCWEAHEKEAVRKAWVKISRRLDARAASEGPTYEFEAITRDTLIRMVSQLQIASELEPTDLLAIPKPEGGVSEAWWEAPNHPALNVGVSIEVRGGKIHSTSLMILQGDVTMSFPIGAPDANGKSKAWPAALEFVVRVLLPKNPL